jgi:tripartite-type tricarboxylate transporter receptor subunit TctC
VRTPPDGYTLLMATAANAINSSLYGQLSFDFLRDFDMVAGIIKMQNVLEVHPSVPARTVSELVAYAKDNPTKLTFGSAGIGSPGHVSGELFKMMTGIKMSHVPYRGVAPALSDLIAGHIQVLIDNMATAIEHIRTGAVRALAVTTATRSTLLPELPTINETIAGYDASSWFGVSAPKGTPRDVIENLNRAVNATLDEPSIAERFEKLGGAPMPGSSADFQRFVVEETDKWGRVIRFAGAKAE